MLKDGLKFKYMYRIKPFKLFEKGWYLFYNSVIIEYKNQCTRHFIGLSTSIQSWTHKKKLFKKP